MPRIRSDSGAQEGVEQFVQRLEEFHDSLPEDQQAMLQTILDTAQGAAETSGYMMTPNVYVAEMVAREQQKDRLRDAELARRAFMAQGTADADETDSGATSSRRFAWLYRWLPAARTPETGS